MILLNKYLTTLLFADEIFSVVGICTIPNISITAWLFLAKNHPTLYTRSEVGIIISSFICTAFFSDRIEWRKKFLYFSAMLCGYNIRNYTITQRCVVMYLLVASRILLLCSRTAVRAASLPSRDCFSLSSNALYTSTSVYCRGVRLTARAPLCPLYTV